ncbi:deoxyribose-phosphate aldolase [Roseomonas sp. KE0001]|uniref:deoxyribose-phosphate aldolase n=1 Tax=Roseomonas sp. KE0001 TaxID=2479201 RepID=UPI0018DFDA70|nr:deoxyribose-phosphate aldolase [Roseomonas sp. KE0001]MBI0433674.1 deoxyribose-phosphate aldolase [Roseomonas sp. KE0001]
MVQAQSGPISAAALAKLIDHTLLKPEAGQAELRRWAEEARAHGFCSVCVNPVNVAQVAGLLSGSGVRTCSVVGFPLGATTPEAKAFETARAVRDGADEIDMVINIGALRDGRLDAVRADIAAVRAACPGRVLKVIIETCLLDEAQKRIACRLAVEAGADFVKTSTGFSTGGATEADIALMRAEVGPRIGVKASGGVRTLAQAQAMIAAGATRIGASSGVALVSGAVPAATAGY